MNDGGPNRLFARAQWIVPAVGLAAAGVSIALPYVEIAKGQSYLDYSLELNGRLTIEYAVAFLPFLVVGFLIVRRRPLNGVGWSLLGVYVAQSLGQMCRAIAKFWQFDWAEHAALYPTGPFIAPSGLISGPLPWYLHVLGYTGRALATAALLGAFVFVPLIFPNGRLLSRSWLWVPAVALVLGTWTVATSSGRPDYVPQIGWAFLDWLVTDSFAANVLSIAVLAGAWASLVVRYRRAESVERQQLKLLAYYGFLVGVVAVTSVLGRYPFEVTLWLPVEAPVVAALLFPVVIGIAVLRYHLYDIDVVIDRTLVFLGLCLFVVVASATAIWALGRLVTQATDLETSVVAAGLVALGFQPARSRLQRVAARFVYGRRADAQDVYSSFSSNLEEASPPREQLDLLARLLADGTGAALVRIWVVSDRRLEPIATYPSHSTRAGAVQFLGSELPEFPDVDLVVPIVHDGELLGAVTVTKAPEHKLSRGDSRVAKDLAGQAGLVIRNMRLTADLLERIDQLRESRRRLMTVQDDTRRQLERDLHDAAQHRLLTVKLKAGLVSTLLERPDPDAAKALVHELCSDTDQAISTIRDLAHGIYPPLLASEGVARAIAAEAQRLPVPVVVAAPEFGRHPQEVEAALYFCLLEALSNAVKHARADLITVSLSQGADGIEFAVTDDGDGFDPSEPVLRGGLQNMNDRIEAAGGTLAITSSPSGGTSITGRLPASGGAPHPSARHLARAR